MLTALSILAIVAFFYLLGLSADLVITNVRSIGRKLGIPVFALGLMLGILTSLPEFGIGVNSLIQDTPSISVGNLLGGTLVLFGIVLGIGIVLNRGVKTDGKTETLWPVFGYLLLPLLFGLSGSLDAFAGLALFLLYPGIMLYLYLTHEHKKGQLANGAPRRGIIKELVIALFGLVGVVVLSNLIVRLTLPILEFFDVPGFIVGLVAYSLGTNLPELIVSVRAWRKHVRDLSFSNILGSAVTNPGMLGAFAMIRPLPVSVNLSYILLIGATLALFGLVLRFYQTGKKLTRNEGLALIATYVVFLLLEAPMFARLIGHHEV
ncbi:hypothetical protein M0Q28_03750 [Patescibacteria group bacterium]|jgi:cation:H+ antiporter|nr:hypothetical protein [Patescibacteria group bacterium]